MYKIYPPRTVFGEERDKRTRPDTVWPGWNVSLALSNTIWNTFKPMVL